MDAEWLAMARRCARLAARRGEPLNGFRCRVHSTYTVQGHVASARACLSRFTPELGARDGIPFIYFEEARQGPVHGTRFSVREHAPRLGQPSISTCDLVALLLHERRAESPLVPGLRMAKHRALAFPILLLPIATFATAWVAAVPRQLQAGSNDLQRGLYGPASVEYFGPYLEEHDSMDPRVSRLDNVDGHRDPRFNEPTGRDLDLPATVTLGRVDVLPTGRRVDGSPNEIHHRSTVERSAKRNIDEIDRTAFDNFVKRNLEKQLIGWNGLVKRLNDFLVLARSNDFETVA